MTKTDAKETSKTPLPTPEEAPFILLSTVCTKHLVATQRSDTFVKRFKDAISEEEIDAGIYRQEKFTLPKLFHKRDQGGTHQKEIRDYIIQNDDKFQKWFEETNTSLVATREGKVPVTLDNITSGLIDFADLVRGTREGIRQSKEKGRNLGLTHGKKNGKRGKDEPELDEVEVDEAEVDEVVEEKPAKKAAKPAPKKAKPAPVVEEDEDNDDLLDE